MKIFVIEYKDKWSFKGFLEADTMAEAVKWFAENAPAKSRIIKIAEGDNKGLSNIKETFAK